MNQAVSLDEVKAYLRIGGSATDSIIRALAADCEEWVQRFCGVQFGETRRTDLLDGGGKNLWLARGPLRQVVSVVDREQPDAAVVADVDYFVVVGDRLLKRPGGMYGAWRSRLDQVAERWASGPERWQVTYDCGYALPDTGEATCYPLPAGLKVAVLELTRRAFDRGGREGEPRVVWQALAGTDILQLLAPYMRLEPDPKGART